MSEPSQWNNLIEDWQACEIVQVSQDKAPIDIKTLQKNTHKRARKMKLFMWVDIITAVLSFAVFGYLLTTDINIYQAAMFIGVMIIIVPVGFYSVWARRGLWQANGNDTKAYLELARSRALAGIKLARANIIASYIIFPFIIGVIIWRAYIQFDTLNWPFNIHVLVTLLEASLMFGMIYGARYYQRKKDAELKRLNNMIQEWAANN